MDRHLTVKRDQKTLVGGNKHCRVKGNHLEKIDSDMSLQVLGKRDEKVGTVYAVESGQEIHLKSGMKIIIESGAQVSLIGPGGFIDIGPAGVTIQGIMVKINSGGSPGSGTSANPKDPEDPEIGKA
jgi:type VI secretion system secreted protein VgrG